ncbi:ADP-ribosylglycohydrolase family protein [Blastopirellula marina]|uniref:ADP-ribosylglycohydrolase n=1 Tax=Blastopirellula marina TaxID=124 RepID=A0A2S8F9H2_9BACT|nr:ADP-ribosylglycohydrolase family protein [Blastopirellula marina]PQO28813.1 hypothetical protein C5Y98_23850 [Blastopirellula marina]PTL42086.1 hypothetical protein C5Y97_23865 [Blastopirellula marina]
MSVSLEERFQGSLLGLAVGDALGGRFEAQSAEHLRQRFSGVESLINYVADEIWYTDDTQMTIALAEVLADQGEILEQPLCAAFVANYVPSRGYGRGARMVIEAMEEGEGYQAVASKHFPGGSYGNGAAMRVAPVGLFFHDNEARLLEQARQSAFPTHVHPLGIEGAQLIAAAVAYVTRSDEFKRDDFFRLLISHCQSEEYREKLAMASETTSIEQLAALGNGIEALESVPTAIASFALSPESYAETIGNVILLGGDTDTLAAMAGAISGAYLGVEAIPKRLLDRLEESPKGKAYLRNLASRLLLKYQATHSG